MCDKNKYEQREYCTLVSYIFSLLLVCDASKRHHTFGKRSFAKNRMCAARLQIEWSISVFFTFCLKQIYIFRIVDSQIKRAGRLCRRT